MYKQVSLLDLNKELQIKVDRAINRLKAFEPAEGYWLAFSGGKDSVVLKALADMAAVKYEAHYSVTNVDPPELVRFIKTFDDVIFDYPEETMWRLIVRKRMAPTRTVRYCCEALKESKGVGRVTLTGVRWAESAKRKRNRNLVNIGSRHGKTVFNDDNDEARRAVESCYRTRKTLVNPIIEWTNEDVWRFIRQNHLRYCCLYDEGWKRLGCIGCPMAGPKQRIKHFERWPAYKRLYIKAFDRMIEQRVADGKPSLYYATGDECFEWWIAEPSRKKQSDIDANQIGLFDEF